MTRGMRAMELIALMSPLILLSRPDASLADWSAIANAKVLSPYDFNGPSVALSIVQGLLLQHEYVTWSAIFLLR